MRPVAVLLVLLLGVASNSNNAVHASTKLAAPASDTDVEHSCAPANRVLIYLTKVANRMIASEASRQEFPLFGIPDNHIDPLRFNDKVTAQTKGEVCLDPKCITIAGKELCSPKMCADGTALAGVQEVKGLSKARIAKAECLHWEEQNEGEISAQGTVELSCEEVDGDVHAEARAKVAGAEVKTSSSGKVTVTNVRPTATLDVVLTYTSDPAAGKRRFQVKSARVVSAKMAYDSVDIHINNLGALDLLTSRLTGAVRRLLEPWLNLDGKVDGALQQRLDAVISEAIPHVNKMLDAMPF